MDNKWRNEEVVNGENSNSNLRSNVKWETVEIDLTIQTGYDECIRWREDMRSLVYVVVVACGKSYCSGVVWNKRFL
jgi:hypothetical protein